MAGVIVFFASITPFASYSAYRNRRPAVVDPSDAVSRVRVAVRQPDRPLRSPAGRRRSTLLGRSGLIHANAATGRPRPPVQIDSRGIRDATMAERPGSSTAPRPRDGSRASVTTVDCATRARGRCSVAPARLRFARRPDVPRGSGRPGHMRPPACAAASLGRAARASSRASRVRLSVPSARPAASTRRRGAPGAIRRAAPAPAETTIATTSVQRDASRAPLPMSRAARFIPMPTGGRR